MLTHVTDGGLETDLVFHHGVDLPEFAAFPLVDSEMGRELLLSYYRQYAAIAESTGKGLVLETPTWRANPDWATKVGYDAEQTARVNMAAVDLLRQIGGSTARLSGVVGPRGDGYIAQDTQAEEASDYHRLQINALAAAGVDVIHAMTLTTPEEAIGIVTTAREFNIPVGISFTVETDGRLPDGSTLSQAIGKVDAVCAPDWYGINCAHPLHVLAGLDGGAWQGRIKLFRPNASTMTHEELDAMDVLDEGDRDLLVSTTDQLLTSVPSIEVLGGCCGTDSTHVRALFGLNA